MSDYTNRRHLKSDKFLSPYVGGSLNRKDLNFETGRYQDQNRVIQDKKNNLPDFFHNDARNYSKGNNPQTSNHIQDIERQFLPPVNDGYFDPYIGFLYQNGLYNGKSRTLLDRQFVNIDSRHRNKDPVIEKEYSIGLVRNPLVFTNGSNSVFIKHDGHPFAAGDKISLSGAVGTYAPLSMIFTNGGEQLKALEFTSGSAFVKVRYAHNLNENYTDEDVYVTISGVKANVNNTYLDNIPINTINARHKVILEYDGDNNVESDYFLIKLDLEYSGTFDPDNYRIELRFQAVAGVPLSYINAEFPVDVDNNQGFHEITSATSEGYYITLVKNAVLETQMDLGGGGIEVAKIKIISNGYSSANNYIISLEKTFHNVAMIRLVSTEIPNTEKVFKENTNKLYWQNKDDGEHVYSIEVEPGNYTPEELVDVIHNKIYNTERINVENDAENNPNIANYTKNHYIQVSIDTASDIVKFRSFRESELLRPIVEVTPDIQESAALDSDNLGEEKFILTIEHANHSLAVGDIVLIKDCASHMGIPSAKINKEHRVHAVIDKDNYQIQLDRLNLSETRINNKGGLAVLAYTPNQFRLRFDYSDTMGSILGFRNAGQSTSISSYVIEFSNKDEYAQDIAKNSSGDDIIITNNHLNLSGDNYIIMTCSNFETLLDNGSIKRAFAKLLLSDVPGKTIFNQYVSIPAIFNDPIGELSELEFTFYNPEGNLYDFEGLDHSFTLEIVTIREDPQGTGASAKTGRLNTFDITERLNIN